VARGTNTLVVPMFQFGAKKRRLAFVTKKSFQRLRRVMTNILSDRDTEVQTAYRELLELRERVRKAERASKSGKSDRSKPTKRRR
jgi:hypothetical protein